MKPAILILNAGSSSVKFAVYAQADTLPVLLCGSIAALGSAPRLPLRSLAEAYPDRLIGNAPVSPGATGQVIFDKLAQRGMTKAIAALATRLYMAGSTSPIRLF